MVLLAAIGKKTNDETTKKSGFLRQSLAFGNFDEEKIKSTRVRRKDAEQWANAGDKSF